jgi:hypothetical protein
MKHEDEVRVFDLEIHSTFEATGGARMAVRPKGPLGAALIARSLIA